MKTRRFLMTAVAVAFPIALACCGEREAVAPLPQPVPLILKPERAKIAVKPKAVSFDALGAGAAKTVTVTDKGYDGKLKESGTCRGIVALAPKTGKGPSFKLRVTPERNGDCVVTIKDSKKNEGKLKVAVAAPSPSPSTSPTGVPTTVPTLSPTPIPPTPTPSPTPAPVTVRPGTIAICPSTGSDACDNSSAVVTVSQNTFLGSFGESDDCPSTVATVTFASRIGETSKFNVTGVSATGTCTATFTGGGGRQNTLTIKVESNGVVINEQREK